MPSKRLKPSLLTTLIELILRGAGSGTVVVSTAELGRGLGTSQQAASKHLMQLEELGFIRKKPMGRKTGVILTEYGLSHITEMLSKLQRALGMSPSHITLSGRIVSGIGEGAYYMTLEGYRKQFRKVLGIDPYPGTLNIKLAGQADVLRRNQLKHLGGLRIEDWRNEKRTYGGLTCFPASVNSKLDGFLCLIDRTTHDETIVEFIAKKNVKKTLGLKDGDPLTIAVRI